MLTGFYFANNSGYGIKAWKEVKRWNRVYMDYELGTSLPMLLRKKLWVTFNMTDPANESEEAIRKMVRSLKRGLFRPKWNKVIALELGDELKWPIVKINAIAARVNKVVREEGLPAKPIGITFHEDQILNGDRWKAAGLDWIGLEAYLMEIPGETPQQAATRMRQYITKLLARVGNSKKIILVEQGYNRNGAWKDRETLVAIQRPTYEMAKLLGDRLIMLAVFAYVRGTPQDPVGTRYIPELKAEIKRLFTGG